MYTGIHRAALNNKCSTAAAMHRVLFYNKRNSRTVHSCCWLDHIYQLYRNVCMYAVCTVQLTIVSGEQQSMVNEILGYITSFNEQLCKQGTCDFSHSKWAAVITGVQSITTLTVLFHRRCRAHDNSHWISGFTATSLSFERSMNEIQVLFTISIPSVYDYFYRLEIFF